MKKIVDSKLIAFLLPLAIILGVFVVSDRDTAQNAITGIGIVLYVAFFGLRKFLNE